MASCNTIDIFCNPSQWLGQQSIDVLPVRPRHMASSTWRQHVQQLATLRSPGTTLVLSMSSSMRQGHCITEIHVMMDFFCGCYTCISCTEAIRLMFVCYDFASCMLWWSLSATKLCDKKFQKKHCSYEMMMCHSIMMVCLHRSLFIISDNIWCSRADHYSCANGEAGCLFMSVCCFIMTDKIFDVLLQTTTAAQMAYTTTPAPAGPMVRLNLCFMSLVVPNSLWDSMYSRIHTHAYTCVNRYLQAYICAYIYIYIYIYI